MNREEVLNAVAEMSVLELSELIKDMEEKFTRIQYNTIKTLFLVAICFIACWSTNQIYYFIILLFN